ncbi:hypothetical protein F2P81_014423 [Scophthalmus maximus]|uniref:Uncharacterized protein n=1 Tax=Scophthalmus maximus TaxID=52904 RepID=A0A6A4SME0_SCOMX|nr:hypothetical protein F2P81_014423 [Scophthalmus maximus]
MCLSVPERGSSVEKLLLQIRDRPPYTNETIKGPQGFPAQGVEHPPWERSGASIIRLDFDAHRVLPRAFPSATTAACSQTSG